MASGISSSIDNKKLLKALEQFPSNVQKNIMVGATRAGANIIKNEAKANVPVDTGNLRKSIKILKRKAKVKTEVRFSVSPMRESNLNFRGLSRGSYSHKIKELKGFRKAGGYYAHMVEFGTSSMAATPFMRPAFESQTDESLTATKKYIMERIPKEVAKAKR